MCDYNRNLKILPWFGAISTFDALLPFYVIYAKNCGLSYLEIFITQVMFALTLLLLDLPLGILADLYSRRIMLLLSRIFFFIAISFLVFWPVFWGFVLAEICYAVSFAARTGIDTSLLFETTKSLGIEDSYCQEEGRYQSYARYSEALSGILGGMTAMISISLPAILTWILSFPGLLLSFVLYDKKPQNHSNFSQKLSFKCHAQIKLMKDLLFNSNHEFLSIFLYSGLLSAMIINTFWLLQVFLKTYQVNYVLIGVLCFIYHATSGFVASRMSQFLKYQQIILWLLPILLQLMCMVLAYSHSACFFPFFLLASVTFGIKMPFIYNLLHPKIDNNIRAGLMSIDSFFTRLFFCIIALPLGWILDNISLNMGFWFLSLPNLLIFWLVLKNKMV